MARSGWVRGERSPPCAALLRPTIISHMEQQAAQKPELFRPPVASPHPSTAHNKQKGLCSSVVVVDEEKGDAGRRRRERKRKVRCQEIVRAAESETHQNSNPLLPCLLECCCCCSPLPLSCSPKPKTRPPPPPHHDQRSRGVRREPPTHAVSFGSLQLNAKGVGDSDEVFADASAVEAK